MTLSILLELFSYFFGDCEIGILGQMPDLLRAGCVNCSAWKTLIDWWGVAVTGGGIVIEMRCVRRRLLRLSVGIRRLLGELMWMLDWRWGSRMLIILSNRCAVSLYVIVLGYRIIRVS